MQVAYVIVTGLLSPRCAKSRAVASPIPPDAPVTMAMFRKFVRTPW